MKNVYIYTLPNCKWCDKAKQLFSLLEVNYTEICGKVEAHPTVPYIEIDGEPVGGYTELIAYCRNL
jgi:glutaredoxin